MTSTATPAATDTVKPDVWCRCTSGSTVAGGNDHLFRTGACKAPAPVRQNLSR